jgi:hypothetical protein
MATKPDEEIRTFASSLETLTEDELFAAMAYLEEASEQEGETKGTDVLARIELVETEIEQRFPGQLLTPYKRWKTDHLDS